MGDKREKAKKPTTLWFAIKRSVYCRPEPDDVHDPKFKQEKIPRAKKLTRSGCTRSLASLKDVFVHGGKSHIHNPSSICSPRSIGSSELLNPITHEVIVSDSTCELKITKIAFRDGNGGAGHDQGGSSPFVGMIKPGTPGPGVLHQVGSPGRVRGPGSPMRRTSSSGGSRRRGAGFGVIGLSKPRPSTSSLSGFHGVSGFTCCKCALQFAKWEAFEVHHISKHAVTEVVEGDSSRRIVEMICRTRTSASKPDNSGGEIERILKVHSMQRTLAQFEEYREMVKIKASKLSKKHPRCQADGNELLRFYGTTVECSLGMDGSSSLCTSDRCNVCRILRHGFSAKREFTGGVGIFTASTSTRALESVEFSGKDPSQRKCLIVCRVIAGRVHRPLENLREMATQSGFDSLAGKVGVYSNIEELYLLNPNALLPCFVVICRP